MTTIADTDAANSAILRNPDSTPVVPLSTIVIAVSDTKHAEYAFNWALAHFIPKDPHVNIVLMTVIQPHVAAGYFYTAGGTSLLSGASSNYIQDLEDFDTKHAAALLRHFKARLVEKFSVGVEMVVAQGQPQEEIVSHVAKIHANVLIMGSRDLGSMKRFFYII